MVAYEWSKFPSSNLYKDIISKWDEMVADVNLKERDYHNYLQVHPAIFLAYEECHLVISKLKLAGVYETDFVLVREGYSDGTQFDLIEIESPHTKLFDNSGKPTAKFNSAIQQIRDWRRLLVDDKAFFKKTFPTSSTRVIGNSKLNFKIIIGRRNNDQIDLDKRRQIAEENKIEIMSFDRLTEMAKSRLFFSNHADIYSAQMKSMDFHKRNELGNPFYMCTSDSVWRKMCNKGHSHFYSNLIDVILKNRKYNKSFEEFKKTNTAYRII